MFDFEGESAADERPPRSLWARAMAISGAFTAMVVLALAAMLVIGLALLWFVRTVQN